MIGAPRRARTTLSGGETCPPSAGRCAARWPRRPSQRPAHYGGRHRGSALTRSAVRAVVMPRPVEPVDEPRGDRPDAVAARQVIGVQLSNVAVGALEALASSCGWRRPRPPRPVPCLPRDPPSGFAPACVTHYRPARPAIRHHPPTSTLPVIADLERGLFKPVTPGAVKGSTDPPRVWGRHRADLRQYQHPGQTLTHVGKRPLVQENLFDDGRQTPTRVLGRASVRRCGVVWAGQTPM